MIRRNLLLLINSDVVNPIPLVASFEGNVYSIIKPNAYLNLPGDGDYSDTNFHDKIRIFYKVLKFSSSFSMR